MSPGAEGLDPVTGLPCGGLLERTLAAELAAAGAELRGLTLLLLDLEQYPGLAETYSVAQADAALQALAQRLREALPEARLGAFGEAGVIALLSDDRSGAAADREWLREIHGLVTGGIELPGTADALYLNPALGAALYPDHGTSARELLVRARLAARRAAAERPVACAFYQPPDPAVRKRVGLESTIQHGVAAGEFDFRYIPRFSASSGRIVGAEQQLVWRHPREGTLLPAEQLEADQLRHLHELLAETILSRAFEQWRAWQDQRFDPGAVAMSLPGRLLEDRTLLARFQTLMRRYRVPARALAVELPGAAALPAHPTAVTNLRELRRLGVQIILADVGRGLALLQQLQRLPLDALKLDAPLVAAVLADGPATAMAKAAGTMARELQLTLIADGVSSHAQLQYLLQQGCQIFQGPLVARGVEAQALPLRFLGGVTPVLTGPERRPEGERPLVVVVDDDPRLLRAAQRELRRGPWCLAVFDRPAEALQRLAAEPAAVLITDQRMPEMTGVELLRRVREVSPRTTRIIMSAHADVDTLAGAVNEGALFRFLGKPWERQALRQTVEAALAASTEGQ